jgi:apolipoprotein N-acyltransferase
VKITAFQKNILLSCATGLSAAFAFPKINLFFLMWVSFIPLMFVSYNSPPKKAFVYAFIAGIIFNLQANFFLIESTYLFSDFYFIAFSFYFCFCVFFAVYWGLWGAFCSFLRKYCKNAAVFIILSSCAWVAIEYARTYLLGKWPWLMIAYSQYEFLQIIQISEYLGVYGVSFAIMLVNGLLYFGLFNKKKAYAAAAVAVFSLIFIFGAFRLEKFQNFGEEELDFVSVQSNVEQEKKLDNVYRDEMFARLEREANEVAKLKHDLVLWSESEIINMIPVELESYALADKIAKIAGGFNIIGAPYLTGDGVLYNNVFYFDGNGGYLAAHSKNYLVLFGEYMPYQRELSRHFEFLDNSDILSEGSDANVLTDKKLYIGCLICYENFFPDVARRFVLNGAKLLTSHSNNAWFFESSALQKHFAANIFRAVESRKTVIVASNTGISALVEPSGKTSLEAKINEQTLLAGKFRQNDYKTFYVLHGDVFVKLCLLFIAVFAAAALYRNKRRGTGNEDKTKL